MLLTGSIVFWSMVVYLAFKPHTTRLPAMGAVEIVRSRRPDPVSPTPVAPRIARVPQTALPTRATWTAVAGLPVRRALPPGAIAMPGTITARPMPSSR